MRLIRQGLRQAGRRGRGPGHNGDDGGVAAARASSSSMSAAAVALDLRDAPHEPGKYRAPACAESVAIDVPARPDGDTPRCATVSAT